ncbi:hypothetical protein KIL84_015763 [Mauremys mutica]|uniref:Uncharacterized protein n=1 Tax=Mauremys mutica TaxID=74926 RepID=A0A9D4AS76_9SAUR|nr:hypothetical protein KIL84_015763 [Mauremys mutica]
MSSPADTPHQLLGRIRCLAECVGCFGRARPLPAALCYVPRRVCYKLCRDPAAAAGSGRSLLSVSESPARGSKKVAIELRKGTCVRATGEEYCNSQGLWVKLSQVPAGAGHMGATGPHGERHRAGQTPGETGGDGHRERRAQRDRHGERQVETEMDRQAETDIGRDGHRWTDTGRDRRRRTPGETGTERHRAGQTPGETGGDRHRERRAQMDRLGERQADTELDRHRERQAETDIGRDGHRWTDTGRDRRTRT